MLFLLHMGEFLSQFFVTQLDIQQGLTRMQLVPKGILTYPFHAVQWPTGYSVNVM